MKIKTPAEDISLRIAAALANTSAAPSPEGAEPIDTNECDLLGHVPLHLQHLQGLSVTLGKEVLDLMNQLNQKKKEAKIVRDLFFSSLETAVPSGNEHVRVDICDGWAVAGFKEDNAGLAHHVEKTLGEIMREMAGKGRDHGDPRAHSLSDIDDLIGGMAARRKARQHA